MANNSIFTRFFLDKFLYTTSFFYWNDFGKLWVISVDLVVIRSEIEESGKVRILNWLPFLFLNR